MGLFTPFLSKRKRLIGICEQHAESHDIKSPSVIPPIQLKVVLKVKCQGHIITTDLSNGPDIEPQMQAISIQAAMLSRRFYRHTGPVKRMLFNTFSTNLYTADLWTWTHHK